MKFTLRRWFNRERHAVESSANLYNLSTELARWSAKDSVTIRDLCDGVAIFGGVGSGKTSASGAFLACTFFSSGMGGLVLCVKADERARFEAYAKQTGRSESLIIVGEGRPWRCNLLDYLLKRPGVIGSRTAQVTDLLLTVSDLAERDRQGQGKNDQFFRQAARQQISNAVELCALAFGRVSVTLLNQIIATAPRSEDEVRDPRWQSESFCYRVICDAEARIGSDRQQRDFDLAATYFLRELPSFPPETRGSINATWSVLADAFLRGAMAELFDSDTNFVPDMSFGGAVIVLDLPVKVYGRAGVLLQAAFKHLWQLAAEQRPISEDTAPAFLFADEAHELITDHDASFFATSRSVRICSVLISQNLSNYLAALGGETGRHRVESLLGNLGTKIFHANGHAETNRWASALFAKSVQTRLNFSTSRGQHGQSSGGATESFEAKVPEAEFTTLARGGPENQYCAEAILFQGGRVFSATAETYLRVVFRQERG